MAYIKTLNANLDVHMFHLDRSVCVQVAKPISSSSLCSIIDHLPHRLHIGNLLSFALALALALAHL